MPTRYYCDNCRKRMKKDEHKRVRRKRGDVLVEVISGWKQTWNGGILCHDCITEAVRYGQPH